VDGGQAPVHHDRLRFAAQRGNRMCSIALRHNITGAFLALAALRGNSQFKLDIVKTHARAHVAGNFSVRNAFADTNNHGKGFLAISWAVS
jgi:hypothetical protein